MSGDISTIEWHANLDLPEEILSLALESSESFRKSEPLPTQKLLQASSDDSSKNHTRNVSSTRIISALNNFKEKSSERELKKHEVTISSKWSEEMALSGMRGLSVFISDVRNCQNKEQERLRVDKELGNIRTHFKNKNVQFQLLFF
ncbi:hypothetical protein IFM89_030063 [Coptis chinensis]|uniref:Uncharacterized protein n=1 Tax=Coptis chinensis TaxID=261450 RepID=A0A835ING3_9MAGN|nr:hypothetical protein IFM89_030063 [Coptis chinensis]